MQINVISLFNSIIRLIGTLAHLMFSCCLNGFIKQIGKTWIVNKDKPKADYLQNSILKYICPIISKYMFFYI